MRLSGIFRTRSGSRSASQSRSPVKVSPQSDVTSNTQTSSSKKVNSANVKTIPLKPPDPISPSEITNPNNSPNIIHRDQTPNIIHRVLPSKTPPSNFKNKQKQKKKKKKKKKKK